MAGALATHLQKKKTKRPFHTAMLIPMMGFICAWVYPIYVNIFNREVMDVRRETNVGIIVPSEKELGLKETDSHADGKTGDVKTIEDSSQRV